MFMVSVTAHLITIYIIITISYDFKEAVLVSDSIYYEICLTRADLTFDAQQQRYAKIKL